MPKLRLGPKWRQPRIRNGLIQGLVLLFIGLAVVYFGANLVQNLQRLRLPLWI